MASIAEPKVLRPSTSDVRLVIAASSAGTVFEWYDFFIYGTLAGLTGQAFFPAESEVLQLLLVWAGFAVGFGFRPLGAILFGFLGDRLGRKYTFLVMVTLMGIATAGVGLVPSAETIGLVAPALVILFRILQGLALGGEYGGAAIYVCEHAPPDRRGYYSSFIQASVIGGFVLSIAVVLACRFLIPPEEFAAWGWRLPFILSLVLLGISLWMRLKLSESPVFQAMKVAGEVSGNPFVESFTYPGNKKRIFVALFGITAALLALGMLSAMNYGSVAALLTEMFPPRIRYSSMSIPYHIGAGYLGGFLPLISSYIVARTGNAYAGLWYTWVMVAIALAVSTWGIPGGPPRDFADEAA